MHCEPWQVASQVEPALQVMSHVALEHAIVQSALASHTKVHAAVLHVIRHDSPSGQVHVSSLPQWISVSVTVPPPPPPLPDKLQSSAQPPQSSAVIPTNQGL